MPPPDPERPDRETLGIRFGCGAIFGLLLGPTSIFVSLTSRSLASLILASLVCALICGLLAARFGERFWEKVGSWSGWW